MLDYMKSEEDGSKKEVIMSILEEIMSDMGKSRASRYDEDSPDAMKVEIESVKAVPGAELEDVIDKEPEEEVLDGELPGEEVKASDPMEMVMSKEGSYMEDDEMSDSPLYEKMMKYKKMKEKGGM